MTASALIKGVPQIVNKTPMLTDYFRQWLISGFRYVTIRFEFQGTVSEIRLSWTNFVTDVLFFRWCFVFLKIC